MDKQPKSPRLRDITSLNNEAISDADSSSKQVWEISVPSDPESNFCFSIVLSYLLPRISASEKEFSRSLRKLIGKENEKIIEFHLIRQDLKIFNPFIDPKLIFQSKNLRKLVRVLSSRLNELREFLHYEEWNNRLKLKAVSEILNCGIEVYFPPTSNLEGIEISGNVNNYWNTLLNPSISYDTHIISCDLPCKISLFEYEVQIENVFLSIFQVGMNVQDAHSLRLDALEYFLEKAKISKRAVVQVKQLMNNVETHRKNFLPTILQSKLISILLPLYKMSFIPLKLAEIGFETDPAIINAGKPSALCYALLNENSKYIRTLYDYASNYGLVKRFARNTPGFEMNISKVKTVLENDISQIISYQFNKDTKQKVLDRLQQYVQVAEHQNKTVNELLALRKGSSISVTKEIWHFRKNVIQCILENYLQFFHFKSSKGITAERFENYLKFSEYYEKCDFFDFLIFFDNFHLLKKSRGVKFENITTNIEVLMFFAMMSNEHFPKYHHYLECDTKHDEVECEINQNVLRYIPLCLRDRLETEIEAFVQNLKSNDNDDAKIQDLLWNKDIQNDFHSLPHIADALMMVRLKRHIEAALDVSPFSEEIKSVLTIEKALQVIGESIKCPYMPDRVASYLLRSCLPSFLLPKLSHIRNLLSHYKNNTTYGRLQLEKNFQFWDDLRNEISRIRDLFQIVIIIHSSRLKESLVDSATLELQDDTLKQHITEEFDQINQRNVDKEIQKYKVARSNFTDLLVNVINHLKEDIEAGGKLQSKIILGQLKAAEYIISLIYKNTSEKQHGSLLKNAEDLIATFPNDDKDLDQCYLKKLKSFFSKCTEKKNSDSTAYASYPNVEYLCNNFKLNQFTPEDQNEIVTVTTNLYKEILDAKGRLKQHFGNSSNITDEEMGQLLHRIVLVGNVSELSNHLPTKDKVKLLEEICFSENFIENDIKKIIEQNSVKDCYAKKLLVIIAFQKDLNTKIFSSGNLTERVCESLRDFLTKKVKFFLNRVEVIKKILMGDNEEAYPPLEDNIANMPTKYLMCQRYISEMTSRAPLEMAFVDCLNVLERKDFRKWIHKSYNLFTGVNLRNVAVHMSSYNAISEILDETDFPSEIIDKMMQLVSDYDAVSSMLELFYASDVLHKERFEALIENKCKDKHENLAHKVRKCKRWRQYLFLIPLI